MTTSRKSGSPSKRGEAEFWRSWRKPITIEELVASHVIPETLKERLQELLDQARRHFQDNEAYFSSITSQTQKNARDILSIVSKDFEKLQAEWQNINEQSPRAVDLISFFMSATQPWLRRAVDEPGSYVPDYIGVVLGQTIKAMNIVFIELETMRSDSNYVWRESLEDLVCFYVDKLGCPLSGLFADHEKDLPKELDEKVKKRKPYSRGKRDYWHPIPNHASQWFLYDCMRYISPEDADTPVLRSLLKAYWMPGGPVYEEGHSGDFFRVHRKSVKKTRDPKSRS